MTDLQIVDAALAEFSTRDSIPADPVISAIAEVDPVTALELAAVTSRLPEPDEVTSTMIRKAAADPGILHARDALNLLLDLRNRLLLENPVLVTAET